MKTDAGSLKKGHFIEINNEIFQVQKTEHNFRGRGSASLRVKLKNVKSGNALETNFRTADMIDILDIDVVKLQFLYKDSYSLHFMDEKTYEQHVISTPIVGPTANFLKEGDTIFVLMYQGETLAIRPPQTVQLKVTEAEDAIKGDTATSTKKIVVVETGISVAVPLFIKTGDVIVVNPETGEYVERVAK